MLQFIDVFTALLLASFGQGELKPPECGRRPAHFTRIVNGQNAEPHSWPWQVSLLEKWPRKRHICGGTLIRPNWIITASHCVRSYPYPNAYTVVVGAHRHIKTGATTEVQQEFEVKTVYRHKGNTLQNMKHDVAVLELKGSVKNTDKVSPVCLPTEPPKPGTQCYITGWGLRYGNGPSPSVLQQAKVPVVSHKDCANKYSRYDKKAHLCAGQGRSGVCSGDSGGPLVCQKDNKWFLHGVASFGRKGCPTKHYSMFARVTTYLKWIIDRIEGNGPPPETLPPPTVDPNCKDKRKDCASKATFCKFLIEIRRDCARTCKNC